MRSGPWVGCKVLLWDHSLKWARSSLGLASSTGLSSPKQRAPHALRASCSPCRAFRVHPTRGSFGPRQWSTSEPSPPSRHQREARHVDPRGGLRGGVAQNWKDARGVAPLCATSMLVSRSMGFLRFRGPPIGRNGRRDRDLRRVNSLGLLEHQGGDSQVARPRGSSERDSEAQRLLVGATEAKGHS